MDISIKIKGVNMKKIIILTILVLILCSCSNTEKQIKQVTCNEKDEIIQKEENAMLIDVRTKEEYEEKHLKDAINIPYDKITETLSTYGTIDYDIPIIVYCKSGTRSNMAAEALREEGYKNIYNLGSIDNCN